MIAMIVQHSWNAKEKNIIAYVPATGKYAKKNNAKTEMIDEKPERRYPQAV
jgi:hypothetical protein